MRISPLKRFVALPLVLLALGAYAQPAAAQEKSVVVHIGQFSNDLHSVTMGLGLANMMMEKGATVTVFLDREAVRLVSASQPDLIFGDTDAGEMLRKFLAAGGTVLVCPHCADLAGVTEMKEGVVKGTPDSIVQAFMAADIVVDY